MSTTAKDSAHGKADYRVDPKSPLAGAWKSVLGIGVAGLAIAAYGYKADPTRFAFSYLFGYYVSLSLALGSLFFVLVLYITKAAWGVTVRRTAELFMRPMLVLVLLVLPLVFMVGRLFPWAGAKHGGEQGAMEATAEHAPDPQEKPPLPEARGNPAREPLAMRDLPFASPKRVEHAEEAAEDGIIAHKRAYLNPRFFYGRLMAYLFIWWWLTQRYFRWSTEQDKTKALENTAAAQRFAPVAIILFALTLTFFGFDWFLSLEATWYSTIFGVYLFAQFALVSMAVLILATMLLRQSGLLGDAVNVEHYHDMGKLLFGWIVFWSYIAFAQFFLTWYSNIPDELVWFHRRWRDNGGTWKEVSLAIVAFHFFVPFWFLMSRNIKRRLPLLAMGAVCMVVMHVVEAYWVVMPALGPFSPNIVDLGCLFGILGVYLAAVLYGMENYALIPVGDPRLERALEFENA